MIDDGLRDAIDKLCLLCHENAKEKGFWYDPDEPGGMTRINVGEKIALMHSELSEALEADRKLSVLSGAARKVHFAETGEPEGFTVELADVLIRIFDFAGALNLPLGDAVLIKMAYNQTRPHKHGKGY